MQNVTGIVVFFMNCGLKLYQSSHKTFGNILKADAEGAGLNPS